MCFALKQLASESIALSHTPKISAILSCYFLMVAKGFGDLINLLLKLIKQKYLSLILLSPIVIRDFSPL